MKNIDSRFQDELCIWSCLADRMLWENCRNMPADELAIYRTTDEYRDLIKIRNCMQLITIPEYQCIFKVLEYSACMDNFYAILRKAHISNMTLVSMNQRIESFWREAEENRKRRAEQKAEIRRKFNAIGARKE